MKCKGCVFFTGEHDNGGQSYGACNLKRTYCFDDSNCQFKGKEDLIKEYVKKLREELELCRNR